MGFSLAWIGVHGTGPDTLQMLGLAQTGRRGEFFDFDIAGRSLDNGWYVVTAKGCDHAIISDSSLAALSAANDVVACSIEEHVMFHRASFWSKGREIWRIEHHGGDVGIMHLEVTGSLPSAFEEIRAKYIAAQEAEGGESAEVDYICEIPLGLAQTLVGFKHDEACADDPNEAFCELQGLDSSPLVRKPAGGNWLRRMFGSKA